MSEKRQTTLNTKEREKLKSFYGEEGQGHPLFLACEAAFIPRAGRLDEAMAEPEDIFVLVAGLLDYIFNQKAALSQHDVDSKFDAMVKSIRGWNNTSTNDRIVIADTVFRIARKLLCHHWNTYFSDEVFDMLTTTIDGKGVADREESDEFQSLLTNGSETLSEWINNGYTGRLSEEVEAIAAGRKIEKNKASIFLNDDSGMKEQALKDELNRRDEKMARKIIFVAKYIGWIGDVSYTQAKAEFGDIFGSRNSYSRMMGKRKDTERISQDEIMNIQEALAKRLES